jgi:dsDNA-binding SOS-regulon protein
VSNIPKLIKDHYLKFIIVISLFLICLSISILMKKWFDLNSDYLSAFATLVAAAVALHLYTDWRKPIFLNKVEDEQKEIKRNIRLFKKSADSILLFLSTKKPLHTGLNNGDQFSLEYQEIMTNLLDITDDLFTLLDNYRLIFNENIQSEHIKFINENSESLEKIYRVIGKFNPVIHYISSYNLVETELKKEEFAQLLRRIIVDLPDGLSKFYKEIYNENRP